MDRRTTECHGRAMSAGCVPIVTNVGNIPTVIKNGENGILVNVERTVRLNIICMIYGKIIISFGA